MHICETSQILAYTTRLQDTINYISKEYIMKISGIYYHRNMEKVIPLPPLGTQGRKEIFLILKAHLQDIEMGSKT